MQKNRHTWVIMLQILASISAIRFEEIYATQRVLLLSY